MAVSPDAAVDTSEPPHAARASASEIRLVFLTNIIAPYWKVIFDALSPRYKHLRILLSTQMEANRRWEVDWEGLDVAVQKTITLHRQWRHPKGFAERTYLHLPLDTIGQLKSFDAEVVISNEMGLRTLLAWVYRKTHPASRLIVWAEIAELTEQGRGWLRGVLRRFLAKRADGFIVLGRSGARYIQSLGTDPRKIFRVPYTTDVKRFAAAPLTRPGEAARRLLYVGQLIERKGLLPFLRALAKWASAHPNRNIEFAIAGDGPLRNQIARESIPSNLKLNLLEHIAYADLPHTYAAAGIFVFPTLADTWGVVVNEALASGLPVLGSMYSQAVEELVEDGHNGWIFRPDDADEMSRAIDRSMNVSLSELNDMRQRARKTALEITPDYVADRIDAVVKHIAGDRE